MVIDPVMLCHLRISLVALGTTMRSAPNTRGRGAVDARRACQPRGPKQIALVGRA